MNNVPSSAILAIVSVICAVMAGMLIFLVVNGGVLSGGHANQTALGLTGKAADEIYTDYDGQQVTGRQVLAAIEKMKGQGVSVAVVD